MMLKTGSSTNQPKEPSHQSTPDAARLPNRRDFFTRMALDAVTGIGTLQLGSQVIGAAQSAPAPAKQVGENLVREYPYTNTDTEIAPGASFRNLGVCHASWSFLRFRGVILQELHRADVVLLEGFAGQDYFDYIAALAHQSGKRVVRLEGDLSLIPGIAMSMSPLANAVLTYSNGAHFCDRAAAALGTKAAKLRATNPSVRRSAITLLACAVSEMFQICPVPPDYREYPADDSSHIVDGRTVIMLDEISKIVQLNKNLSVLAITGDAHARGFRFYTSSPERQQLFQEKVALYNRVYKSWLGGHAMLEDDPAQVPNL